MTDEQRIEGQACGNAAAYVLGALPDEEREGFERHLESCAECREEAASLRVVVAALAAAVPQRPAPGELKRAVMRTVTREAREQLAASSDGGVAVSRPRVRLRLRLPVSGGSLAGLAAAAAVVVAVLALGGGGERTRVFHAQVTIPGARALVDVSGTHAELIVAGMPQSPSEHVYELWIKKSGQPLPTDALFTVSFGGRATVGVPGSIKGVTELLVTAEPLGGSPAPTRTPVIVASLRT